MPSLHADEAPASELDLRCLEGRDVVVEAFRCGEARPDPVPHAGPTPPAPGARA